MRRRIGGILLFGALLVCAPQAAAAATGSVRVIVSIDGLSDLRLSGNTAQWHHLQWSPPQVTQLNGVSWTPTGLSGFCNCLSDLFAGVAPAIPQTATNFGVTWTGRGLVTLPELPSALNGYLLRVRFDDATQGGADLYNALITYDYPDPVPTMSGTGLVVLSVLLLALTAGALRRP